MMFDFLISLKKKKSFSFYLNEPLQLPGIYTPPPETQKVEKDKLFFKKGV